MEGIFTAKVISYGITETKAGDAQAMVSFEIIEEKKQMAWFGSFKEGRAQEITLDALLTLGYTSKGFADFADGKGINVSNEYSLTIGMEADLKGELKPKIKWVNSMGGAAMKNKLSKEDAIKKIKGMNLDAALVQRMNLKGVKPGMIKDSDISF